MPANVISSWHLDELQSFSDRVRTLLSLAIVFALSLSLSRLPSEGPPVTWHALGAPKQARRRAPRAALANYQLTEDHDIRLLLSTSLTSLHSLLRKAVTFELPEVLPDELPDDDDEELEELDEDDEGELEFELEFDFSRSCLLILSITCRSRGRARIRVTEHSIK